MTTKAKSSDSEFETNELRHPQELQEGRVERTTGSFYRVRFQDGSRTECVLRGKIRLNELDLTNPIAVGDLVRVRREDGIQVIQDILPRENYIIRRATKSTAKRQILCSNIDQAVIIFTIEKPHTPFGFLDSFLVTAGAYHIPAAVVVNKIDLLRQSKQHKLDEFLEVYRNLGYRVEALSANDPDSISIAQDLLSGKKSFLTGRSGSGKSTFVNLADPNLNLKTAEVSKTHRYGRHTTTFAEMFELEAGGWVIDAPGVREFHLTDLELSEVAHYFPEMLDKLSECRFHNCLHVNEPDCAVLEGIESGEISETRYMSYLYMLEELKSHQEY